MSTNRILHWDYKEQVNFERLNQAVYEVSGGMVSITEVDTGGDEFGIVVASPPQTKKEAQAEWDGES